MEYFPEKLTHHAVNIVIYTPLINLCNISSCLNSITILYMYFANQVSDPYTYTCTSISPVADLASVYMICALRF